MINMRSSTVRVYEQCKRKWMLQFMRKDVQTSKAMDWGTAMHAALELWFKNGTPPDENLATGKAAIASFKHLPAPSRTLAIEHTWLTPLFNDTVLYSGTIDLADFTIQYDEYGRRYAWMYDHKSTAGVDWIKTGPELSVDVSATAYANWMITTYALDYVKCRWVYTTRDAKQSIPVDFAITAQMAEDRWKKTLANVSEMVLLMQTPPADVMSVIEPTLSHCQEFGGCPYRRMCGIKDPVDWLSRPKKQIIKEIETMSSALLEALKAKTKTATPAPAPVVEDVLVAINPPKPTTGLASYSNEELIAELTKRLKS